MEFQIQPINDFKEEDLYNFLLLIDNDIVPPISDRLNLRENPIKIKKLSIGKVVTYQNNIIGLSVYYPPNTEDNYIYWTLLAVKIDFRGKNIGRLLIDNMIKIAKGHKANGIKSQTWSTAKNLISYYKTFGFEPYNIIDNRGTNVKSLLLKIDF